MTDLITAAGTKGWTSADVKKTRDILAHAEEAKSTSMRFLEQTSFWVALLIAIIGNFVISVVMVPFLLLLQGVTLYLAVFVIGVTFGTLINVVVGYIEKLKAGQHIIAGAFIPALALINVYIITHFSNNLEILLQLKTPPHSPLLVSVVYVTSFVIPYLLEHFDHVRTKTL